MVSIAVACTGRQMEDSLALRLQQAVPRDWSTVDVIHGDVCTTLPELSPLSEECVRCVRRVSFTTT